MSGPAKPTTFGPGSLESIRLERRVAGTRRFPDSKHLDARVRGTFRVYCGAGNEHAATMTGQWAIVSYFDPTGRQPIPPSLRRIDTDHDFTDADALAHELVETELEDWSDPCEVDE